MRFLLSHPHFVDDPYDAFAKKYGVPRDVWVEIYHNRHLWLDYKIPELVEIFYILSKLERNAVLMNQKTMRRWISRTKAYNKAQKTLALGAREVTEEWFDKDMQHYVKKIQMRRM